jgi:hypothetical protein
VGALFDATSATFVTTLPVVAFEVLPGTLLADAPTCGPDCCDGWRLAVDVGRGTADLGPAAGVGSPLALATCALSVFCFRAAVLDGATSPVAVCRAMAFGWAASACAVGEIVGFPDCRATDGDAVFDGCAVGLVWVSRFVTDATDC